MAQKQFRLTSDGFRKSVRQEVSSKFQKEENLFYQVFEEQGYSKQSRILKDNHNFKKKFMDQNDALSILVEQIEQQYQFCTVEHLVNRIIDTIQTFHLDNQEDQVEINTLIDYQNMLSRIYDKTAQLNFTIKPKREKCFLEIFHIKNLDFATDIFKYYQIKYKARIVSQDNVTNMMNQDEKKEVSYKSIYEQKSKNLWRDQFSEKNTHLEIAVFGKRKTNNKDQEMLLEESAVQENGQNRDYEQISKMLVDFNLIFACIHPKQFEQSTIHTKVNVQFKDQTNNPPYQGQTTIQMGFNLILDNETKLFVMDKLLDYFCTDIDKLNYEIVERVNLINDILISFKQKIVYKPQRGLEENHQTTERNACQIQNCSIF